MPPLTSRFSGAGHEAKGAACSLLVERIWDSLTAMTFARYM
jgi:hypothetical protein